MGTKITVSYIQAFQIIVDYEEILAVEMPIEKAFEFNVFTRLVLAINILSQKIFNILVFYDFTGDPLPSGEFLLDSNGDTLIDTNSFILRDSS